LPTPSPTPSATPTPTPTPTPDGWSLVFEDTFDTPVAEGQFLADGRWGAYPYPWPDTWGRGKYDPAIISVHDGLLDMHLRSIDGVWRSASISPRVNGTTLYSTTLRIEVSLRTTSSTGYHASFLTWPQSEDWPPDGELDFPEGRLDGTVSAFMHRQDATTGSDQDAYSTTARFTEQHTYVTDWVGGTSATFYLDGTLIGHSTNRVPLGPHRIQLQVQTAASGTLAPAHVYIDSVRVWTQ
jgi:hypothetical protein